MIPKAIVPLVLIGLLVLVLVPIPLAHASALSLDGSGKSNNVGTSVSISCSLTMASSPDVIEVWLTTSAHPVNESQLPTDSKGLTYHLIATGGENLLQGFGWYAITASSGSDTITIPTTFASGSYGGSTYYNGINCLAIANANTSAGIGVFDKGTGGAIPRGAAGTHTLTWAGNSATTHPYTFITIFSLDGLANGLFSATNGTAYTTSAGFTLIQNAPSGNGIGVEMASQYLIASTFFSSSVTFDNGVCGTSSCGIEGLAVIGSATSNPITVTTSPAPLTNSLVVDGTTYSSPQTFNWVGGSSHNATAIKSLIQNGQQYGFGYWGTSTPLTWYTNDESNTLNTASFVVPSIAIGLGDTIIISASTNVTVSSVGDTTGNTFTLQSSVTPSGVGFIISSYFYTAPVTHTGGDTVTIHYSHQAVSVSTIYVVGNINSSAVTITSTGTASGSSYGFSVGSTTPTVGSFVVAEVGSPICNTGTSTMTDPNYGPTFGNPTSSTLCDATHDWQLTGAGLENSPWGTYSAGATTAAGTTTQTTPSNTGRWSEILAYFPPLGQFQTTPSTPALPSNRYLPITAPSSPMTYTATYFDATIVSNASSPNVGQHLLLTATTNEPPSQLCISGNCTGVLPWQIAIYNITAGTHTQLASCFTNQTSSSCTVKLHITSSRAQQFMSEITASPYGINALGGSVANSTALAITPGGSVHITVETNPLNLMNGIFINGTAHSTTVVLTLTPGRPLNLTAAVKVLGPGATVYSFSLWSDAGARYHVITVPETDTTYIAYFNSGGGGGGGCPGTPFQELQEACWLPAIVNWYSNGSSGLNGGIGLSYFLAIVIGDIDIALFLSTRSGLIAGTVFTVSVAILGFALPGVFPSLAYFTLIVMPAAVIYKAYTLRS